MAHVQHIPKNDPLAIPADREKIDAILEKNKDLAGATMVVLNELQNTIGFISEPMQAYVARNLKVPISAVHGVVSFYSFFTTSPRGKHTIKFCMGTACYVRGAERVLDEFKEILKIKVGETTKDDKFSLSSLRCVGACGLAPVVLVGEKVYGRVTLDGVQEILDEYKEVSTVPSEY